MSIRNANSSGTVYACYGYNSTEGLVKVQFGGVAIMTCEYDGLNRRIVKTDDGVTKHSYYNEDWQELEVRKESGGSEVSTPIEQLVWHPYYIDALATRFWDANATGSQTQYYLTHDANFNVTAAVNTSGTVVERYDYSPYGVISIMSGTFVNDSDQTSDIGNTTTYTGRKLDRLVGIYYYRNRYYDPAMGRFLTRDPIGYAGSEWSLYEYVASSPVHRKDPYGLKSKDECLEEHKKRSEDIGHEYGKSMQECESLRCTRPEIYKMCVLDAIMKFNDKAIDSFKEFERCIDDADDDDDDPDDDPAPNTPPGAPPFWVQKGRFVNTVKAIPHIAISACKRAAMAFTVIIPDCLIPKPPRWDDRPPQA